MCVRNVPVDLPGELSMYVSQVPPPPHDLIQGITIRPRPLSIMDYLDYIVLWINMDCVLLYPDLPPTCTRRGSNGLALPHLSRAQGSNFDERFLMRRV